ncbi:MAG: hypothetical protein WBV25_03770, partial [Methylocella sp.]
AGALRTKTARAREERSLGRTCAAVALSARGLPFGFVRETVYPCLRGEERERCVGAPVPHILSKWRHLDLRAGPREL